jgi:hypothetical protein
MTPTTRCKFRCDTIISRAHSYTEIELSAVMPNEEDGFVHSKEDHAFWNATPTGKLTLGIQNPYGAELFQAGESYYLDISKAPAAA